MHKCMEGAHFDWNRARAFLLTAELGSFSKAALELGVAQPTLGRQVSALENELGVVLFERIGSKLSLTPTGRAMQTHLRDMAEAAAHVKMIADGESMGLEGLVRIASSDTLATHYLPPVLERIRAAHPGISIELVTSNSASDLQRREADLAIRHFRPEEDELIGRRLADGEAHLYGTHAYLESLGPIASPADLSGAQVISFGDHALFLGALTAAGLTMTETNLMLRAENQNAQWALARRGLGLCLMMKEVGDRDPAMRRAHDDLEAIAFPMWLVCHRELRTSPRLRVVYELVAEALAQRGASMTPKPSSPRR